MSSKPISMRKMKRAERSKFYRKRSLTQHMGGAKRKYQKGPDFIGETKKKTRPPFCKADEFSNCGGGPTRNISASDSSLYFEQGFFPD